MSGVALPTNALVILAIIFIVILTLFAPSGGVYSSGLGIESAKSNACRALINQNCNADDLATIPVSGVGDISNLEDLCEQKYQVSGDDCKVLCGCPITVSFPPLGPPDQLQG